MLLVASLLATLTLPGALGFPAEDTGDSALLLQLEEKPRASHGGALSKFPESWQKLLKCGSAEEFQRELNKTAKAKPAAVVGAMKNEQSPFMNPGMASVTPMDIQAAIGSVMLGMQIFDTGVSRNIFMGREILRTSGQRAIVVIDTVRNLSFNGTGADVAEKIPEAEIDGLWDAMKSWTDLMWANFYVFDNSMTNLSLEMEEFFTNSQAARFPGVTEFGTHWFSDEKRERDRAIFYGGLHTASETMNLTGLPKLQKIGEITKVAAALSGMMEGILIHLGPILDSERTGTENDVIDSLRSSPMGLLLPARIYDLMLAVNRKIHVFTHVTLDIGIQVWNTTEVIFSNGLFPRPIGEESGAPRPRGLGGLLLALAASCLALLAGA